MPVTVLVVEDQKKLNEMVADYLRSLEYEVVQVYDGMAARREVGTRQIDIAIIDVVIPGLDGFDLLKTIRKLEGENQSIPIIMLTARTEETDRLMGLELGADDYVTKPFSLKELEARIRAVMRRIHPDRKEIANTPVIEVRDLRMDRERRTVHRGRNLLDLTTVQFDLLQALMMRPGRVFTRIELLETFQDMGFEGYERTIDVHIKNIRKSIEPDPTRPVYLKTVWGVGYKLEETS